MFRMWVRACLAAVLVLGACGPVAAVQPDEILKDKSLEQRARAISAELRCLVCQNQSIDDSDAPLAKDLRVLVRERLMAGDSDTAVRDFVVARYGDFVLLRPPFNTHTLLLWVAPFLVLALAAGLVVRMVRRPMAAAPAPAPLSATEEARLKSLMEGEGKPPAVQ